MHILGILVFLMALIVAIEVIRQTISTHSSRILEALAGVGPQTSDIHTERVTRILPFNPVVTRPALFRETFRKAA